MNKLLIIPTMLLSLAVMAQQPTKKPAAKPAATTKPSAKPAAAKPAAKPNPSTPLRVTQKPAVKSAAKPLPIAIGTKNSKPQTPNMGDTIAFPSGLKIKYKKRGTGTKPMMGDKVKVHYTGTLLNGTKFDSSKDRNDPFSFDLGMGRVIRGWDEGFATMSVGDEATLIIPPGLGYGDQDMGTIPPNSTLIFDVELLGVEQNPDNKPVNLTGIDVKTTASGLKYYFITQGNGRKPVAGQKVSIHYVAKLMTGLKFESSRDAGKPITFSLGAGQVFPGWDEGIALMGVGDKAFFVLPPELALGSRSAGPIPANSTLAFEIELLDANDAVKPQEFDVKGKDTVTTKSGLKYIVVSKGTGAKAEVGKPVSVHYTGTLLNGKVFDSSIDRGEPITFNLGTGQVIKGWDEGIALMSIGDKFRLIIPPNIAYGERDMGSIPSKSTLVFDVELMP